MSDARTAILERIAAANGSRGSLAEAERTGELLPRDYVATGQRTVAQTLDLLEERLRDYDATVTRCRAAELAATLRMVLEAAHAHRVGIPSGLERDLLPAGFDFIMDDGMPAAGLDSLDAVLTGCAVAIAETGTFVLQSSAEQGRRALTLVPDVHVCLVRTSDVVETVPEAFARLQPTASLPTTFVSGPSATADIEMTRIKGVHGPRFLYVVLIEDR